MKISLLILICAILFSFGSLFGQETEEECSLESTHQLEQSLGPILEVLKSKNNKLFQTLFAVLKDISTYQETFNDKNDQFKLAYTFYLLKSFADLEEQSISSDDITLILSIIKDKYKFDIPPVAFQIVKRIKKLSVIHNRDGSRSIKLTSTDGKPIAINLAQMIPQDPKNAKGLKMNWFIIQSDAEIRFSEYGRAKSQEEVASFLNRSTITKKSDLLSANDIDQMKRYFSKYSGELKPAYVKLSGFTIKFDLEGENVKQADLRGGLLMPQFKDSKNKDRPNFYIGLTNIKVGILSLDAELPL